MSDKALAALAKVIDPELRRPITELGMVGEIAESGSSVRAEIKLTIVGCPAAQSIERDVRQALESAFEEVEVDMTTMTAQEREGLKVKLRGNKPIRHNPALASPQSPPTWQSRLPSRVTTSGYWMQTSLAIRYQEFLASRLSQQRLTS